MTGKFLSQEQWVILKEIIGGVLLFFILYVVLVLGLCL